MLFSPDDLHAFWSAPWSVPLRSACHWLTPAEQTRVSPATKAPRWLTPLCVQRWVGKAIAARFAWMRDHPEAALYRYSGPADEGDPSIPCWTTKGTVSYGWLCLEEATEAQILKRWAVEVERLLHTCEAPPALVGEDFWALAALRICEHLNQLYTELKRRHKAMRARTLIREALSQYITWDYRVAA
jgi:hypothetical protein